MPSPRRAFTLLECLVFSVVWMTVALFTMRALSEAALVRGAARQRAEIALIAQSELERIRSLPAVQLQAGQTTSTQETWPARTESQITLEPYPGGNWQVQVSVRRETLQGLPPVTLATIRRGGAQ